MAKDYLKGVYYICQLTKMMIAYVQFDIIWPARQRKRNPVR